MLNKHTFEGYEVALTNLREGLSMSFNEESEYYYLLYISSGKGTLTTKNQQLKAEEGRSYFLSDPGEITSSSFVLLSVYMLSWPKGDDMISGYLSGPLAEQMPIKMVPLWEGLKKMNKQLSLTSKCRFQALLWEILSILTDDSEVDRIDQALELIRNHLSQPLTLTELASKANMSPVTFTRAFRKRTGMTPKEFFIEERMKKAKRLMLQKKGITAKEVALQVGIQDEFYFSRLFKSKEGFPPSIFMKRAKERVAVVSQLFLQDHLISLGIQPVAAPSYPTVYPRSNGVPRYLQKELEGTKLLNAEKPFQPDEILLTYPDYIIKTPLHNHELQNILFSQHDKVHYLPLQPNWRHYLYEMASMLDRVSLAECIDQRMTSLERKVRDELYGFTKRGSWAVLWIRPREIRLYGQGGHALLDLLFHNLGFQPHTELHFDGYRLVTLEELTHLNPDKLLIIWSHESDVWKVARTPEWNKIKAVRTGEVYYPESHEWDPWGPRGREKMLEEFSSSMLKAKLKA